MRAKRTVAYTCTSIRCVRGQVPGTARGGARIKSAINYTQASGYVITHGVAGYRRRIPAPSPNPQGRRVKCTVRRQSLAPHHHERCNGCQMITRELVTTAYFSACGSQVTRMSTCVGDSLTPPTNRNIRICSREQVND